MGGADGPPFYRFVAVKFGSEASIYQPIPPDSASPCSVGLQSGLQSVNDIVLQAHTLPLSKAINLPSAETAGILESPPMTAAVLSSAQACAVHTAVASNGPAQDEWGKPAAWGWRVAD